MKCVQLIAGNAGKITPLNLKLTEMLNKCTNPKNQKNKFFIVKHARPLVTNLRCLVKYVKRT